MNRILKIVFHFIVKSIFYQIKDINNLTDDIENGIM